MKQLYQKSHGRVKLDVKPVNNITVYNSIYRTVDIGNLKSHRRWPDSNRSNIYIYWFS